MLKNTTQGTRVTIQGHTARLTGESTIGKSGRTYFAVEAAKRAVNGGKKARIIGWGKAQWVREEMMSA